ncbi:hypothetical protein SERLADRAFT_382050, partial [Serpula lacrymans var. lacrymans S7.9]
GASDGLEPVPVARDFFEAGTCGARVICIPSISFGYPRGGAGQEEKRHSECKPLPL